MVVLRYNIVSCTLVAQLILLLLLLLPSPLKWDHKIKSSHYKRSMTAEDENGK